MNQKLIEQFQSETGLDATGTAGDPFVHYVEWLEGKVLESSRTPGHKQVDDVNGCFGCAFYGCDLCHEVVCDVG